MKFYNFFLIINNKMKFELLELLYLNQTKTNEKQTVKCFDSKDIENKITVK